VLDSVSPGPDMASASAPQPIPASPPATTVNEEEHHPAATAPTDRGEEAAGAGAQPRGSPAVERPSTAGGSADKQQVRIAFLLLYMQCASRLVHWPAGGAPPPAALVASCSQQVRWLQRGSDTIGCRFACVQRDMHAHPYSTCNLCLPMPTARTDLSVCFQVPWLTNSQRVCVDMTEAPINGAHLLPQVEATTAVNLRLKNVTSGEFVPGVCALFGSSLWPGTPASACGAALNDSSTPPLPVLAHPQQRFQAATASSAAGRCPFRIDTRLAQHAPYLLQGCTYLRLAGRTAVPAGADACLARLAPRMLPLLAAGWVAPSLTYGPSLSPPPEEQDMPARSSEL
jgi:hypothetical protein